MQEIPKTLFPFARNYSLKSAAVVKLVAETCRVEGGTVCMSDVYIIIVTLF